MNTADKQQMIHLELFKSLIKDGAEWHGDIISKKWGECLYLSSSNPDVKQKVLLTLENYAEGTEYKWNGEFAVFI